MNHPTTEGVRTRPLSADAAALLNALSRHLGCKRGIGAAALAQQIGCSPRRLRTLVSELRDDGIAVCGHPSTGYFIATTPAELKQSLAFLEHRALHSLRLLCRMRNVSMPELLGQLKLNQA